MRVPPAERHGPPFAQGQILDRSRGGMMDDLGGRRDAKRGRSQVEIFGIPVEEKNRGHCAGEELSGRVAELPEPFLDRLPGTEDFPNFPQIVGRHFTPVPPPWRRGCVCARDSPPRRGKPRAARRAPPAERTPPPNSARAATPL